MYRNDLFKKKKTLDIFVLETHIVDIQSNCPFLNVFVLNFNSCKDNCII